MVKSVSKVSIKETNKLSPAVASSSQSYTVTISASPSAISLPNTGFSGTAGTTLMNYPVNIANKRANGRRSHHLAQRETRHLG